MTYFVWALTQEKKILLHVNNKGADQTAQLRSLISAFVVRTLVTDSMMVKLATHKIIDILASLCSCVGWFDFCQVTNPEDRFSRVKAYIKPCNENIRTYKDCEVGIDKPSDANW